MQSQWDHCIIGTGVDVSRTGHVDRLELNQALRVNGCMQRLSTNEDLSGLHRQCVCVDSRRHRKRFFNVRSAVRCGASFRCDAATARGSNRRFANGRHHLIRRRAGSCVRFQRCARAGYRERRSAASPTENRYRSSGLRNTAMTTTRHSVIAVAVAPAEGVWISSPDFGGRSSYVA